MPETSNSENPTSISHEVLRAIVRRKETHQLQVDLEAAWKSASQQFQSLNRPFRADTITDPALRKSAKAGEEKRRKIDALAQEGFLLLHELTDEKYPSQLQIAEELERTLIPGEPLPEQSTHFLQKEARAKAEFHRAVVKVQRNLKRLIKEAKTIRAIPCGIPKMDKAIQTELEIVEAFLKSTNQTLSIKYPA